MMSASKTAKLSLSPRHVCTSLTVYLSIFCPSRLNKHTHPGTFRTPPFTHPPVLICGNVCVLLKCASFINSCLLTVSAVQTESLTFLKNSNWCVFFYSHLSSRDSRFNQTLKLLVSAQHSH